VLLGWLAWLGVCDILDERSHVHLAASKFARAREDREK
jgi:hypothetical protein